MKAIGQTNYATNEKVAENSNSKSTIVLTENDLTSDLRMMTTSLKKNSICLEPSESLQSHLESRLQCNANSFLIDFN